mgnify:CR=1 FL=1
MKFNSLKIILRVLFFFIIKINIFSQEMPTIVFSKSESEETGIKIEFLLSDYVERSNVSGWIEQDNWFILNFYNIIKPDLNFTDNISSYPIQKIEKSWENNDLQLSFQISRKLGSFDVILYDGGEKVLVVLKFAEYVEEKVINPSYVFPDDKNIKKKSHPLSWKDSRERTTLEIICDTKGLPVYVDNQLVGYSPLKHGIDVLPGWHKVGYFPNDYSEDSKRLTPKEKMVNDILVMGRLDVFVEEGKHETIVLNYQSLDEDVIDYNKRFQVGTWTGFSLFFLMILLMSWGLA